MEKVSLPKGKRLILKLEQLDHLPATEFRQALAELRELERQKIFVQPSLEAGRFYTIFSIVLNSLGNHQEALEKALKAFQILKDTNEIQKILKVQIILGDIYVQLGDLKNAQAEYRDAFAFYRKQEPCENLLRLFNKLAHVNFVKGEFNKAIEYLKDGIEYSKQLNNAYLLLQLSMNLSSTYLYLGKYQLAEELHLVVFAHPTYEKNEIVQVFWFLTHANVLIKKRKFPDAKECLDKSHDLIIKHSLVREKAIYHEHSGELAFEIGDFISADEHYLEALRIGEEIAPQGDIVSQVCRLLAALKFAQGKYDEALDYCQRSLRASQKNQERIEEGIVYRILGQIHAVRGESELAKENFKKGISILKEIGARCELGKAYLEAGKSDCYDYFERLKSLGQAEEVLKDTDLRYYLAKSYLALAEFLYNSQEYEKGISFAQDAEELFRKLNEEKDLAATSRIKKEIEDELTKKSLSDESSKLVFSNVITQNGIMLDIIKRLKQVLNTDLTILLEGDTGTGKDFLAKTTHFSSNRKDKRYISINCANLPETLCESELFGYKKGAFTGANADKKGLLEEADGGTLLLNEIGEVPLPIQAKLLSIIEEKEFTRLGDTKPIKVDVRFIAATNQDLKKAVEERKFREDLYYRLSVIKVQLPALRERKEDILLLIRHFMGKHCDGNCRNVEELSMKMTENLFAYDWPGNIRELENEILKFSTLMGARKGSDLDDFIVQLRTEKMGVSHNGTIAERKIEVEIEEIKKALRICNNIKSKAAEILSMPESTLRRKIRIYNIS